ncbi:MAG TPA: ABC transporter transmembrane domain-containing protein [Thermoleophilaceae bacterium]|nr:ABC transporter transmembrane domain-containing protein [Thermoleophilaceae bacterium]
MGHQDSRSYEGLALYRALMLEARPYWVHIAGLLGLGLLSSVFVLLSPLPLKIAVDTLAGSQPPGFISALLPAGAEDSQTGVLLVAAGLFVLIALLQQAQEFGYLVLSTYTGEKLLLDFRSRLFRHAERLSLAYHDAAGTADSAYRIQYDAMAVQTLAVTGLIPFFVAIVTVAGMIYVTATIDWELALVSVAVAPILFAAMRHYRKRLRARWHDAKQLDSAALSVVQESLDALRVVKAFGGEDHARGRFADRSAAGMRAKVDLAVVEGRFGIAVGATIGAGMGAVLFLGSRRVLAGAMTLGDLVLVMGYLQQLYSPVKTAAKKAGSLQSSLASADRAYALLAQAPDFVDAPDAEPLPRAAGAVEFREVSFGYDTRGPVLHRISFTVKPGTRVAIAGPTGAGKTTLVNLIARFYEPTSGEILIDRLDVRRYRVADLRNQFAIVLQEPVLFSTTIGENILYARPGARRDEVVAAAKAASAHDFIEALPDGYDTPVGERGVCLSGGERQRISLARAFLKDAPVLILDEPTSSVDARTERDILDAMKRLMVGRTAFMIAHRESTLEICDARLDLADGRIVATTLPKRAARRAPKHVPVPCDPAAHPVVDAWRAIAPAGARPERVDRLRLKANLQIYRLWIADGKTTVIAKRAPAKDLMLERTICERVLPQLPHPRLRTLGWVWDGDAEYAWLFREDRGDAPCSLAEHGRLAARWLGTLHGAAATIDVVPLLPARGPGYFGDQLRSGQAMMVEGLENEALGADDKDLLASLIATSEAIEAHWTKVDTTCRDLPETLLHGDVDARNLRLRRDKSGPALVAVDWAWSGFGVPAVDVYQLALHATPDDLASYRAMASSFGAAIDQDALEALVFVGKGFRLISCVSWVVPHLPFAWPERATATLRCYERPLRDWAETLARL